MQNKTPEKLEYTEPIKYTFPINMRESILFASKGARLCSAQLWADDLLLSEIKFGENINEHLFDSKLNEYNIDFFCGQPFHTALINSKIKLSLILSVSPDENMSKLPSLVYKFVERKTWDDILPQSIFILPVDVYLGESSIKKELVYSIERIGYYPQKQKKELQN